MADNEDRAVHTFEEDHPAAAAIGRMFDKAAEDADLASLVELLREAYEGERWSTRELTRILEQATIEDTQR